MNTPRITYIIEDSFTGAAISASRDESEAREIGEMVQEFTPDHDFYLVPVTLQ